MSKEKASATGQQEPLLRAYPGALQMAVTEPNPSSEGLSLCSRASPVSPSPTPLSIALRLSSPNCFHKRAHQLQDAYLEFPCTPGSSPGPHPFWTSIWLSEPFLSQSFWLWKFFGKQYHAAFTICKCYFRFYVLFGITWQGILSLGMLKKCFI